MSNMSTFPDTSYFNQSKQLLQNPFFEIPFLIIVTSFGTVGNLLIVAAVKTDRKLRVAGIEYILNLAVADIFITAWYLPVVLANVLVGYKNALEDIPFLCNFLGFGSALCCQVSMLSLMAIATNRYLKVLHPNTHEKFFSKRWQVGTAITALWVQGLLISLPIAVGWFNTRKMVGFDSLMLSCMWNDRETYHKSYNYFLISLAIFLPLIITAFCYYKLFVYFRNSALISNARKARIQNNMTHDTASTWSTEIPRIKTHFSRHSSIERHQRRNKRKEEEREKRLMQSVLVVLICFLLSWLPYAFMSLIDTTSSAVVKRACGWLALSNSAINSVIYGLMNVHFRNAYTKLFRKIFFCSSKRSRKVVSKSSDNLTCHYTIPTVTFDPNIQ